MHDRLLSGIEQGQYFVVLLYISVKQVKKTIINFVLCYY